MERNLLVFGVAVLLLVLGVLGWRLFAPPALEPPPPTASAPSGAPPAHPVVIPPPPPAALPVAPGLAAPAPIAVPPVAPPTAVAPSAPSPPPPAAAPAAAPQPAPVKPASGRFAGPPTHWADATPEEAEAVARSSAPVEERLNAVRFLGERGTKAQWQSVLDLKLQDADPSVRQAADAAVVQMRRRLGDRPWPNPSLRPSPPQPTAE